MKQRYIPFGYTISEGKTILNETESKAVRWIFTQYVNGASYQTISKVMSDKGVPYHTDNSSWNKNMIKRILENERYLGSDCYPTILSKEQFERATSVRAQKYKILILSHLIFKQ